jgi:hypothetical protein
LYAMLMMSSGMTAGLVVSLAMRFVWAGMARMRWQAQWLDAGVVNELLYITGHCLLGAGLGLVFWLSWGFTALVEMSWWQRGTAFGVIIAVVFGGLPLLLMRSLLRVPAAVALFWLSEVLLLGVTAGLNCSWHWQGAL